MKKQILQKEYVLTPENDKSNLYIPFSLKEEGEKLAITFSYTPVFLDNKLKTDILTETLYHADAIFYCKQDIVAAVNSIQNLITLSLDFEDEYIGCHHHKQNEQVVEISQVASSLGFIKHRVLPGQWQIVMNLHCIVSPEVKLTIKVEVIA